MSGSGTSFPPNQGVETPALLGSRRVGLSVAALQEVGGKATEEQDLAVERLVDRGPEMFMHPAEQESARTVALEESVTDTVAQGLSVSQAERLVYNVTTLPRPAAAGNTMRV